jgi:ketosteroid isomerase-like protein
MELDTWIESYRVAWERGDVELAASLFTEDATYRSLIFDEPNVGQEGVADYWRRVTAPQEEVSVRMGRPFVDGDRVAVEWWTRMTVEGQVVTLPGCLLLRFASDGRCRQLREYWNLQEGAHEPPSEWGT